MGKPNGSDRRRVDYSRGLPGYHDPTARWGGAAPARSALTLRLWLAGFGVLFCAVAAWLADRAGIGWLSVALIVVAVISAVDLGWVAYRKHRGEPG